MVLRVRYDPAMEVLLNVHIEALEEGGFLAASDDLPGLLAQGRTVAETI